LRVRKKTSVQPSPDCGCRGPSAFRLGRGVDVALEEELNSESQLGLPSAWSPLRMMKRHRSSIGLHAALLCLSGCFSLSLAHEPSGLAADEALRRLDLGNARFVRGQLSETTPASIADSRRKVAQGQKPFAIIVGCSDSRVGPEVIFDQQLGALFVIRTAGEVVDPVGLGSIEYAVAHLGSRLIVVLGHERCGAVTAAVSGAKEPGHFSAVLKAIRPAVRMVKGSAGDPVENAVRAQALHVAAQLQASGPILKKAVRSGELEIVAARYDLDSGKVSLMSAARQSSHLFEWRTQVPR